MSDADFSWVGSFTSSHQLYEPIERKRLQKFGLFYGPVLFSAPLVRTDIAKIWTLDSRLIHIVLDPALPPQAYPI